MAYKIEWSLEAVETLENTLLYLEEQWTEKEVENFSDLVKSKLKLLQTQPYLGRLTLRKNIRRTVLHKRVTLTYRVRVRKKEIELISFWNNWRNPGKSSF